MNSQRRLRYMKALGIPIWLARTQQHNTETQTHTETATTALETEVIDHSQTVNSATEHALADDEQMAMQAYEQYAQYDSSVQTAISSDPIPTASVDIAAFTTNLINSLDTDNSSSLQHLASQNTLHATSETTSAQPLSNTEEQLTVSESQSNSEAQITVSDTDIKSAQIISESSTNTKTGTIDQNTPPINVPVETLNWDDLQQTVQQCQFCEMAKFRSNTVFGSGNINAKWLFIGEAPDVEDDQQGLPFLAKSGQLLDNILAAINLDREAVYLSNILKCRPPNDRDPHVDEAKHCMHYLHRQIELIQPKVIVVVGRVATKNLLQIKKPLGKMRGHIHYFGTARIPVVVTYHPRYLLRQPSAKRKVWEDIQLAQSVLQA